MATPLNYKMPGSIDIVNIHFGAGLLRLDWTVLLKTTEQNEPIHT